MKTFRLWTQIMFVSLIGAAISACSPVEFATQQASLDEKGLGDGDTNTDQDIADEDDSDEGSDEESKDCNDNKRRNHHADRGGQGSERVVGGQPDLVQRYRLKDTEILYLYQEVTPAITMEWSKSLAGEFPSETCERALAQSVGPLQRDLQREIELEECKSLIVAAALRASQGQCQANSNVIHNVGIEGVLGHTISFEVNEDCLCFKKYQSQVAQVIGQEIWVSAPAEECSQISSAHSPNVLDPILEEVESKYGF